MALSTLCNLCQQIFEGRWIENDAWELSSDTTPHRIEDLDGVSEYSPEAISYSQPDLASSFDYHWSPDWVKVIDGELDASDAASTLSPPYHTITDLQESARNGCSLCTAFADLVHDKLKALDDSTEEFVSRLSGIVIVRPSQDACDVSNSLVLEISYFVDGTIEEDSCCFSVDLLLLSHQSEHFAHLFVFISISR